MKVSKHITESLVATESLFNGLREVYKSLSPYQRYILIDKFGSKEAIVSRMFYRILPEIDMVVDEMVTSAPKQPINFS